MSFNLRAAETSDKELWYRYDAHLPEREFDRKIKNEECFIIEQDGKGVGVLRYNLFWDSIPFLTLIYIDTEYHGKGIGKKAMAQWESKMRSMGHTAAMTSTQVDENAQHFYRKLGYADCGCLVSEILDQPMEMFMIKKL